MDRFGKSAVVIFESVGSAKLELVVQEELTRWIGKLHQLILGSARSMTIYRWDHGFRGLFIKAALVSDSLRTVHRMTSKKEKWAQEGSEFTTSITRGDSSKVASSAFNG